MSKNISQNQFFCAMPFHHLMVKTNGDYNVCCSHMMPSQKRMNINSHSIEVWRNSEYVKEVQEYMINNIPHPGCQKCWQRESEKLGSLRQRTSLEYKILGIDIDNPVIKNCEIDLENTCNLTCLMCNENHSSAILAENKKLGINKIEQVDVKWKQQGYDSLEKLVSEHDIKVLNVRGGEPMYNKKLLELLEKIPASKTNNMVLHITTNATRYSEEWENVFKKFSLVRVMFSIDAVGPLFEYIRFPAKWNEVCENIKKFRALPNVKPLVNCTVQNLNISALVDLVKWCQETNIFLTLDMLTFPGYMHFTNLPVAQKEIAINNLEEFLHQPIIGNETSIDNNYKLIMQCLNVLKETKNNDLLWNNFVKEISMRDKVRNNSFRDFIIE
jgi:MoaA/NifB/PqqE/SkfB family radical SAM enzyme